MNERKTMYYEDMVRTARRLCHDLNQPLQAISGYAELLTLTIPPDDGSYPKVLKIQESSRRVNELVNELMNGVLKIQEDGPGEENIP